LTPSLWVPLVWGRGDARRLYIGVFLVGVFITVFLSNDATALILTPVVYHPGRWRRHEQGFMA
jgi:arsenical pump membrane protein